MKARYRVMVEQFHNALASPHTGHAMFLTYDTASVFALGMDVVVQGDDGGELTRVTLRQDAQLVIVYDRQRRKMTHYPQDYQ